MYNMDNEHAAPDAVRFGLLFDKYNPVVQEPQAPLDYSALQTQLDRLPALRDVELEFKEDCPEEFELSSSQYDLHNRQSRRIPLTEERNSPIKTRTRKKVSIRHTSVKNGVLRGVENYAAYDQTVLSHAKDAAAIENVQQRNDGFLDGYVSIEDATEREELKMAMPDNMPRAVPVTSAKMDPDLKPEDLELPKPKFVYQFRPVSDLTTENAQILFEKEYEQLELTVLRTIPVKYNQREENALIKETLWMYYQLLRELYNSCCGGDGVLRVSAFLDILEQCKVQDEAKLPSTLIIEEITELCNDMFSTHHGGRMPLPVVHAEDYDDDEGVSSSRSGNGGDGGAPSTATRLIREPKTGISVFDEREHLKTLSRPQFLCSLYQVALSKFFELDGPPSEKLMSLFDDHIVPHADAISVDYFKRKLLAAPIQDLYRRFERHLYNLFLRYCGIAPLPTRGQTSSTTSRQRYGERVLEPYTRKAVANARFTPQNQHLLLVDYLLLGKNLTSKKALQAYLASRDENTMVHSTLYLGYSSFLEMLARLAALRRPENVMGMLKARNIAKNSVAELVVQLDSLLQILCHHKKAQSIFTRSKIHRMVQRFKLRHPAMAKRSVEFFSRLAHDSEFKNEEELARKRRLEKLGVGQIEEDEWIEYEFDLFPYNLRSEYTPEASQDAGMLAFYRQGMDTLTDVSRIYPDKSIS